MPYTNQYYFSLEYITSKQQRTIKSSIVNANNYLNKVFSSFNSLNRELFPGKRLINTFSSHILFHKVDCCSNESKTHHCDNHDNIMIKASTKPNIVIVMSDASIKNNVATSITYIYSFNSLLKKTLHHTISITSTKVELFTIRYRINYAVQIPSSSYIIVITNTLHIAQNIFNLSIHLY